MFLHDNPRYRSPASRLGVLELASGKWLALPPGFHTDAPQFDSREKALRTAIARMIRRARRFMRAKEGEGTSWSEGYGGRVIEFALSLKTAALPAWNGHLVMDATLVVEGKEITLAINAANTLAAESPSEEITDLSGKASAKPDPVVAELVAAHRARKVYPAGHTFAMTNPIINGRMVTLGTCSCGDNFSYVWGSYERMDAAIEAHWQKFDASVAMIDGRGNPVKTDGRGENPAKPRKQRKSKDPGAGGLLAPDVADAPQSSRQEPAPIACPSGAGSPSIAEAAPIGAGLELPSGDTAGLQQSMAVAGTDGAASASASQPSYLLAPADPATDEGASGDARSHAPPAFLQTDFSATMAAESAPDWSPLLSEALHLAWREPPKVTDALKELLDFGKVYGLGRKVERPVLRWRGGKWKLAPWIISHFPPHKVYVEPFGGAGSVLMQKLSVQSEVWNDLEGEAVNLFRVLRSNTEDLARLIYLTPFSREEYHTLYEASDDPVERARRFVARSFMGQSSKGALRKSGFDSRINPDGFASRFNAFRAVADEFNAVAERFRNVIIEQRPADAIFAQYDRQDVLFYVDPPYLSERAKYYNHELDEDGHTALLQTLRSLSGMVVLSGYRSELYDDMLGGWRRVETDVHADGGVDRTEVLWINPACAAALDELHPRLFDLAAMDVANTPPTDMMESDTCA